jgi:hypothetical protein
MRLFDGAEHLAFIRAVISSYELIGQHAERVVVRLLGGRLDDCSSLLVEISFG